MKKVFLAAALLLCSTVYAVQDPANEQSEVSKLFASSSKPSDEEIMQIIDKFNFTPQQKEDLFKETKSKLDIIYSQAPRGTSQTPQEQQAQQQE